MPPVPTKVFPKTYAVTPHMRVLFKTRSRCSPTSATHKTIQHYPQLPRSLSPPSRTPRCTPAPRKIYAKLNSRYIGSTTQRSRSEHSTNATSTMKSPHLRARETRRTRRAHRGETARRIQTAAQSPHRHFGRTSTRETRAHPYRRRTAQPEALLGANRKLHFFVATISIAG